METELTTPISLEDIRDLRTGDIVYLTGVLATGRDDVHRRIAREGWESPFDFRDMAIMHAGPIVREGEKNEMISIGPTTSSRMEAYEREFIEKTGVRLLIGKGGMGERTARACRDFGAVHCVFPGGCAVLSASHVEEIEAVFWRELGMPEAIWVLRVRRFGPLIVSIDTRGDNLFQENRELIAARREECERPAMELVSGFFEAP